MMEEDAREVRMVGSEVVGGGGGREEEVGEEQRVQLEEAEEVEVGGRSGELGLVVLAEVVAVAEA